MLRHVASLQIRGLLVYFFFKNRGFCVEIIHHWLPKYVDTPIGFEHEALRIQAGLTCS